MLVVTGASRHRAVRGKISDNRAAEPSGSKKVPGKVHFSYLSRQGSVRVATESLAGKASRHAPPSSVVAGRHDGRGRSNSPTPLRPLRSPLSLGQRSRQAQVGDLRLLSPLFPPSMGLSRAGAE